MASPALESVVHPFTAFNFTVEIVRDDAATPLVAASFAECDGLEMTQEIRTVREGGNNGAQIRLAGPAAFGTITLRRGMTGNFDLWAWFSDSLRDPSLR
ncbi:MAG: phage tail protein, partial [Propionivibrio sp.]|nr:phage tail protein [Propionivibrio sp.]